jgi:hypothetical protein
LLSSGLTHKAVVKKFKQNGFADVKEDSGANVLKISHESKFSMIPTFHSNNDLMEKNFLKKLV